MRELPRVAVSASSERNAASACIDGVIDTAYFVGCETRNEDDPWLEVDMGDTFPVSHVRIYNRDDSGCDNRLGYHEV